MISSAGSDLRFRARSPRVRQSPPRPSSLIRPGEMQPSLWWLRVAAALPLRALYGLAGVIAWVTFRVVKYRRDVVRENLSIAFPEADEAHLRALMRRCYSNFAQVLVEIVKAVHWPAEKIREH